MLKPKKIPLKYHEFAVIPGVLVRDEDSNSVYLLSDGSVAKFEYHCTINVSVEKNASKLDAKCQSLYNMSFEDIRKVWHRRIGKIDDYWHVVRIIKI